MAGIKRNQHLFQTSNSNNKDKNLIVTSCSEEQQTKRQRSENNDKESICWKYFEPFKVPKENGTITKCTIPGCTTRYIWCGSTSNLVGHLKNKHAPFSIVDNLKSAGFVNPKIELSTSIIIEEQINKAHDRLFFQLKSKAQQEKSIMLSIHKTGDLFDEFYEVITCNWLTKDLELHKILLLVKQRYSEYEFDDYKNTIEALERWELTNLKFYRDYDGDCDFFEPLWDSENRKYQEKYQNLVLNIMPLSESIGNPWRLADLIYESLEKWISENINTQEISKVIKVVKNANENLLDIIIFLRNKEVQREIQNMQKIFSYSTIIDIQNSEKIDCTCVYHEIALLKLMEKPFIRLVNNYESYENAFIRKQGKRFKELMLDSLPFGIYSKLLQIFKPLDHHINQYNFGELSMKETMDLVDKIAINANNMLREFQFSDDIEHKVLKSFLTSIPLCFEYRLNHSFVNQLALFLDPRSKPDEIPAVSFIYVINICK
ncbi:26478_t:CDS:2 [Dentiscutata erythropus]|uniref:26478_t:CDS:1 n=1 Tax=Dentiscutata erythropus TaxID=1348616 RepID=A0A9N9G2Y2_9GLOM|nr:26478_t:CDS:2 [Dentiscutata erythropus]